jgi:hypothetical protein
MAVACNKRMTTDPVHRLRAGILAAVVALTTAAVLTTSGAHATPTRVIARSSPDYGPDAPTTTTSTTSTSTTTTAPPNTTTTGPSPTTTTTSPTSAAMRPPADAFLSGSEGATTSTATDRGWLIVHAGETLALQYDTTATPSAMRVSLTTADGGPTDQLQVRPANPASLFVDRTPGVYTLAVRATWPRATTTSHEFLIDVLDDEPVAAGTYVEQSDNAGQFTYPFADGPQVSACQLLRGRQRVWFTVYVGGTRDDEPAATATIDNRSGRVLRFPGGLEVTLHIDGDGGGFDVALTDPAVRALAAGASATVTAPVHVAPGTYDYVAETTIVIDGP